MWDGWNSIRVAPDNKLIAVIMKIQLRGEIEKNTVAQLRAAGITGIVLWNSIAREWMSRIKPRDLPSHRIIRSFLPVLRK